MFLSKEGEGEEGEEDEEGVSEEEGENEEEFEESIESSLHISPSIAIVKVETIADHFDIKIFQETVDDFFIFAYCFLSLRKMS